MIYIRHYHADITSKTAYWDIYKRERFLCFSSRDDASISMMLFTIAECRYYMRAKDDYAFRYANIEIIADYVYDIIIFTFIIAFSSVLFLR